MNEKQARAAFEKLASHPEFSWVTHWGIFRSGIDYARAALAQAQPAVPEPVFTQAMIDAIYAAWHGAGVDIAGGNWRRFVGMLPIYTAPSEQPEQANVQPKGMPADNFRGARRRDAAEATLQRLGYEWHGGELWAPTQAPAPAPAPVAKVVSWTNGSYWRNYKLAWMEGSDNLDVGALLYADPPVAQAPAVAHQQPLTDEQIDALFPMPGKDLMMRTMERNIARAVEHHHGISDSVVPVQNKESSNG